MLKDIRRYSSRRCSQGQPALRTGLHCRLRKRLSDYITLYSQNGSFGRADVAVTVAEPLAYPIRVVMMVAVEEVFADTPLTVTKPVMDIATEPFAVAVPP